MRARTRLDAINRGLRFYFNGKLCPRSHGDKRYATTGRCAQCAIDGERERRDRPKKKRLANIRRMLTQRENWRRRREEPALTGKDVDQPFNWSHDG